MRYEREKGIEAKERERDIGFRKRERDGHV